MYNRAYVEDLVEPSTCFFQMQLDATSSYLHMTTSWEHESFTFCLFNVIFKLVWV